MLLSPIWRVLLCLMSPTWRCTPASTKPSWDSMIPCADHCASPPETYFHVGLSRHERQEKIHIRERNNPEENVYHTMNSREFIVILPAFGNSLNVARDKWSIFVLKLRAWWNKKLNTFLMLFLTALWKLESSIISLSFHFNFLIVTRVLFLWLALLI